MRISDRLRSIYDAVEHGETVADIGTDHGYVPLMLYRDGISPVVIMSDISEGSLAKAKESFALNGIEVPDEWFRCGDGIETIKAGEVDDLIIAGLGGETITSILGDELAKTRTFIKLIIQPRKSPGRVRAFLYSTGYDIVSECLAREGKFICEIITAKLTGEPGRDLPYPNGDIRWKYPGAFRDCDRGLLSERINWKLSSINEEISNLKNSKSDQSDRITLLESDMEYLNTLLI